MQSSISVEQCCPSRFRCRSTSLQGFMSFDADSSHNDIDAIGRALAAADHSLDAACPYPGMPRAEERPPERERRSRGLWHAWAEGPNNLLSVQYLPLYGKMWPNV
jgi:hypothetical protein